MVEHLYERSLQKEHSNIRLTKNNSNLENISKLMDNQLTEQNNYIRGNYINASIFEGYQRENAQTVKDIKSSIELLNKNIHHSNELINKMEVRLTDY